MAVGSTSTFSQERDEIIRDALANLGAVGPDGTPSGVQLLHAARALNRVAKAIDAEGPLLWRVVRRTFTTTSGTATGTPASDVIDVDQFMDYKPASDTTRTAIWQVSRDDFMSIADRTTSGKPTQFMVERVISGTGQEQLTVTFYPVPDTTSDTIEYTAYLRAEDYTSGSTTSPFPTSWLKCLVYGLTAELAPTYRQPSAEWALKFEAEKNRQLAGDNEGGNLTLVPFGNSGGMY